MDYKIVFENRSEYLYVYVEPYRATYDAMYEYCVKIAKAAAAFPGRRVLVEKAACEQLSTGEAFRLASELPAIGFLRVKVAFVDHAENNDELNEFTEMVGSNRGLNTRTFNDVETAERWLISA